MADRLAEAPVHVAWIGDSPTFLPPTGRGRVTTFVVDVDTPSVAVAICAAGRHYVDHYHATKGWRIVPSYAFQNPQRVWFCTVSGWAGS